MDGSERWRALAALRHQHRLPAKRGINHIVPYCEGVLAVATRTFTLSMVPPYCIPCWYVEYGTALSFLFPFSLRPVRGLWVAHKELTTSMNEEVS